MLVFVLTLLSGRLQNPYQLGHEADGLDANFLGLYPLSIESKPVV